MGCITATALLRNNLSASINLSPSLYSTASLNGGFVASINITNEKVTQATSLQDQKLIASTILINSGVNADVCPIIFCIDGGLASTASYPSINGLLNGGSS